MFKFLVTSGFNKSLHSLEQKMQKRIKDKLSIIAKNENPLIFAKKLKGYSNIYRFRVGDYRITFRLDKNIVVILTVNHRKDIYAGL
jgi:mRNA interferase RelE/StbE